MPAHVGTSGWQYRHWDRRFYPVGPRPPDLLAFFGERFSTVEINASFYRLPAADTFASWARATPDDFVFAVKASRFLTHLKRLHHPRPPVRLLMQHARRLGGKLGPVLLQLPPHLRRDDRRLDETLRAFGRQRVAVEFRHESWFHDVVRRLLERRGAALVIADRGSRLASPAWRTADWGYARFHAGRARPEPCYGRTALRSRAALLDEMFARREDVFVYFNNDGHACAPRDAAIFAREMEDRGWSVSRTPAPGDVHAA